MDLDENKNAVTQNGGGKTDETPRHTGKLAIEAPVVVAEQLDPAFTRDKNVPNRPASLFVKHVAQPNEDDCVPTRTLIGSHQGKLAIEAPAVVTEQLDPAFTRDKHVPHSASGELAKLNASLIKNGLTTIGAVQGISGGEEVKFERLTAPVTPRGSLPSTDGKNFPTKHK